MKDWNEMTIDEHIEYLKNYFMLDSSGTAKSVNEVIRAYEQSRSSITNECGFYQQDNTTSMNCKHCGKAKWLHKNANLT